ncbi:hypothetical protein [Streptomyces sp. NRRL S-146]|uniref:hypothetical protein n=1 Tax=Streptomyces sp. NRRL S-146 TaxID=1463884 RepID=UPI00068D9A10|nr:hypothetical protein [Streptomyces sp. NRRL S-146]
MDYAADVTTALIAGWVAIQARHPDVPDAVISMATGGRESQLKLAHFSPNRWVTRKGGTPHHEMFVTAESLSDGAREVFGVLVHEATHASNFARGIKDCSASQYHNRKFRDAAAHMGLKQRPDASDLFRQKYGFAGTTLTDEAAEAYRAQIAALDEAIRAVRQRPALRLRPGRSKEASGKEKGSDPKEDAEGGDGQAQGTSGVEKEERNYVKAICGCSPATVIRVSPRTLTRRNIMCGDCKTSFARED